ncbi:MAG: cysteine--tRNA ligase [Candidatus Omnitrophota bacterium]
MAIKIFNTLTRSKQDFKPIKDSRVGMYVCGPTVYDEPHIGHARSVYVFDVIRSYFEYKGYKVDLIRNVTDIDDKIINKAKEEFKDDDIDTAIKKVSRKYLDSYHDYMSQLGIKEPTKEPMATEYVGKMKDFIAKLIERGAAYESGGDVYFNIKKAKDYGKLSNQSLESLESGTRVSPGDNKLDPLDFALWKSSKEGEPSWDSPWGKGRPGWHIECSVMSSDILGDEFDIHGGGIDLIFPHHENEIAQSEGAGKKFARYWIHNGLLTINKEKMAKSLGNFITMKDVLEKYPADVLKILFLQTHYSHPVDFSWDRMEEAKSAYERIIIMIDKVTRHKTPSYAKASEGRQVTSKNEKNSDTEKFREKFEEAMDDDFNTPKALAVLFDMVSRCNKLLDSDDEWKGFQLCVALDLIKEMAEVLGLEFLPKETSISEKEIQEKIDKRLEHKKNKNYQKADEIRKDLEAKGIVLEDTKDGTTWRIK